MHLSVTTPAECKEVAVLTTDHFPSFSQQDHWVPMTQKSTIRVVRILSVATPSTPHTQFDQDLFQDVIVYTTTSYTVLTSDPQVGSYAVLSANIVNRTNW